MRRLLVHADANPSLISSIPLHRRQVRVAAAELAALAGRVERGGPVSAVGVAPLRSLLTDGGGPLYRSTGPASPRAACAALDVLGPTG